MKTTYRLFLSVALTSAFFIASCDVDEESVEKIDADAHPPLENKIDTSLQNVGQESIKEPEIPADQERQENLTKAASISPFASLGCCQTEENYGEDCCCDDVILEYRNMVAANDTSIARLKMTDPILSKCRKKHQNTFDQIDNPGDDLDDLLGDLLLCL